MDLLDSILSDLRRKRAQVVVEGDSSQTGATPSMYPPISSPTAGSKRKLIPAAAIAGDKCTERQAETPPLIGGSISVSAPSSNDVPALTRSDERKGVELEVPRKTSESSEQPFVASVWKKGQELSESLYKSAWAKKSTDEKAKGKDSFVPDWSITRSDTLWHIPTAQSYLLHSIPPLDREVNQKITRSDRADMLYATTAQIVNLVRGELLDKEEMQKELKRLHEKVDSLMTQKEELNNSYHDVLKENAQLRSDLLDNFGSTNEMLNKQLSDLESTKEMLSKQLSEVFDEDGDFSIAALNKSRRVHELVKTYNRPAVHAAYIRTYKEFKKLNPNMLIDDDFHQVLYRPDVASVVPPWCNPQDLSPVRPSCEETESVIGSFNQDMVRLSLPRAPNPTCHRIIEREEGNSGVKSPMEGVVGGDGNEGTEDSN